MPLIQGLLLNPTPQGISFVSRYVGEPNVPGSIKRRRRWVYDAMRRIGTPVLVKHRYNAADVVTGDAVVSPAFDDVYGSTVSYDAISHGVGYCSAQLSANEWYNTTTGQVVTAAASPGIGYAQAPKYRGYGPGFLVFIIEPDAAMDYFRRSPTGALIKTQKAQAIAPWFPAMYDNDLLMNVELDPAGNVLKATERYELKMATPTSIRGTDKRGRREAIGDGGNRYILNQRFEMVLQPQDHPVATVEIDR